LNTEQLKHHEVPLRKPMVPVILVCDSITSPANAGTLIRLCDAFGVDQLFFCGHRMNLESNRLKKTARSTEKQMTILQQDSILTVLQEFSKKRFGLVGLEISSTSLALQNYAVTDVGIVPVRGNERGNKPGNSVNVR